MVTINYGDKFQFNDRKIKSGNYFLQKMYAFGSMERKNSCGKNQTI